MHEPFYYPAKPKLKILAPRKSRSRHVLLNTNRLSFLPSLFVSLLSMVAAVSVFVYFNPVGLFTRNPQIAGVEEKIILNQASQILNPSAEKAVTDSAEKSILIAKDNLTCRLSYPINFNLPVVAAVVKKNQSWWLPNTEQCSDSNLQAVQITTLSEQEGLSVKSRLNASNIFLISSKDQVYALVYTKNNVVSSYNFSELGENFLDPGFSYAKSFDPLKMHDTKIVDNWSYQLSLGCQARSVELNCILWKQNQFSGVVYKIKSDFFADAQNFNISFNKNSTYMKFAKTQSSNQELNLIVGSLDNSDYFLVKVGVSNNSISSVLKYTTADPDYNLYFR